jgi:dTDP-L-rhamnose 4-epimerase
MRILVTGGAGFIGRRTVRSLLDNGHAVRVLDNLDPQVHGSGSMLPTDLDPRCQFLHGSVEDPRAVDAAIDGMDAIYHLAALTGVGQSMYDLATYTRVTVGGTATLLDRLMRRGQPLQRLVLASSRAVYGEGAARCPQHGVVHPEARHPANLAAGSFHVTCPRCAARCTPVPTAEDTTPATASIYAWTKLQQEELCRQVARVHTLPLTILRYFNVYGEGQSLCNPYTGVVAIFCARLHAGRSLAIYENNQPLRDFVHVSDVVAANLKALTADVSSGTTINIGTGEPLTIGTLARTLGDALGVVTRCEDTHEYRIGDILACIADRTQAQRLLGWEPRVGLAEGLGRFAAWAASQETVDGSDRAAAELRQRGLLAQAGAAS